VVWWWCLLAKLLHRTPNPSPNARGAMQDAWMLTMETPHRGLSPCPVVLTMLQPHAGTRGVSRRNSWVVHYHTSSARLRAAGTWQPGNPGFLIYDVGDDQAYFTVY